MGSLADIIQIVIVVVTPLNHLEFVALRVSVLGQRGIRFQSVVSKNAAARIDHLAASTNLGNVRRWQRLLFSSSAFFGLAKGGNRITGFVPLVHGGSEKIEFVSPTHFRREVGLDVSKRRIILPPVGCVRLVIAGAAIACAFRIRTAVGIVDVVKVLGFIPVLVTTDVNGHQRLVAKHIASLRIPLVGAGVLGRVDSHRHVQLEIVGFVSILGMVQPIWKNLGLVVILKDFGGIKALLDKGSIAEKLDLGAGKPRAGIRRFHQGLPHRSNKCTC
mmetsp:Transcript_15629/g.32327  ORF Transcript_15629/g.32327 Transcript_15629/m.32327 type:complete len:274 (+) Transcript_15629:1924-2745(+)